MLNDTHNTIGPMYIYPLSGMLYTYFVLIKYSTMNTFFNYWQKLQLDSITFNWFLHRKHFSKSKLKILVSIVINLLSRKLYQGLSTNDGTRKFRRYQVEASQSVPARFQWAVKISQGGKTPRSVKANSQMNGSRHRIQDSMHLYTLYNNDAKNYAT